MSDLFIKGISSVIPGFNDSENGSLLSTEEILRNIKKADTSSFDVEFIKNNLGIESVSISKDTLEFVRTHWESGTESTVELFSASQSRKNHSLVSMLQSSIQNAFTSIGSEEREKQSKRVVAHIHIAGFLTTFMEPDFAKIRRDFSIGESPIQTLILQQGCNGLLSALHFAKSLLFGARPGSNVLITAQNDMMIHAHQRVTKNASIDNINRWLWPAIFGEGVGAIIVGSLDTDGPFVNSYARIDHISDEVIENDWRVAHRWKPEEGTAEVAIKAKEVRQSYLTGIKRNVLAGIERCGGLKDVLRVCLHESNPRLIREIRSDLDLPVELVPSISSKVGTLACVSAFSLLDIAFHEMKHQTEKSKVVMALIGEAGGSIIAGHIVLSFPKTR